MRNEKVIDYMSDTVCDGKDVSDFIMTEYANLITEYRLPKRHGKGGRGTVGRNRNSAKTAGTRLETQMEKWLQWAFQDTRIRRNRLHGSKDHGDIGGLFFMGEEVCIECKSTRNGEGGSPRNVRREFEKTLTEAGNIDSPWPVLVKKCDGVTDRDWRAGGRQLAIIRGSDYRRLTANLTEPRWLITFTPLPRNPRLVGMDCKDLFTLFNQGIHLGPDA